MQPGRVILIAIVTSVLTSAGTFFVLKQLVGRSETRVTRRGPLPSSASVAAAPATTPRGSPLPRDEAGGSSATARDSDFQPVAKETEDDPGTSSPGAAPVKEVNTTVTEVKRGVTVPKVQGSWLHSARVALKSAGLSYTLGYRYDEDHSENLVLGQTPPPGARVPRGSAVKLIVNRHF